MTDCGETKEVTPQVLFLIERKRYAQAAGVLGAALSRAPDDSSLLYLSALLDHHQDREEEAEKTLRQLLMSSPRDPDARTLLVSVLMARRQYGEAEQELIGLLRDFPEEADFYVAYARLMLITLHLEKAERLAREALRLEPENPQALSLATICDLVRCEGRQAEGKLAELMRHHPESLDTAWTLLNLLEERKQYGEALRLARELLRSDPANPQYVAMIRELRVLTHPTMWPLAPLIRWGWHGSAALWILGVVGLKLADRVLPEGAVLVLVTLWLGYIAYSWLYPPLLRRLLR